MLTLVQGNVGTYEANDVTTVKIKLKDTARNYVTNEATLADIIQTLRANIQNESSKLLRAKVMNLKRNNTSANTYINELEALCDSLKRAYIIEVVPAVAAEGYITDVAVQALTYNANNDKSKLLMEEGESSAFNAAATEYVAIITKIPPNTSHINFTRVSFGYDKYRNNNRNFIGVTIDIITIILIMVKIDLFKIPKTIIVEVEETIVIAIVV